MKPLSVEMACLLGIQNNIPAVWFRCFFGRFKTPQFPSEITWPLLANIFEKNFLAGSSMKKVNKIDEIKEITKWIGIAQAGIFCSGIYSPFFHATEPYMNNLITLIKMVWLKYNVIEILPRNCISLVLKNRVVYDLPESKHIPTIIIAWRWEAKRWRIRPGKTR